MKLNLKHRPDYGDNDQLTYKMKNEGGNAWKYHTYHRSGILRVVVVLVVACQLKQMDNIDQTSYKFILIPLKPFQQLVTQTISTWTIKKEEHL